MWLQRSVCQQQGDCAVEKIATLDMAAAVRVPTAGRLCSREDSYVGYGCSVDELLTRCVQRSVWLQQAGDCAVEKIATLDMAAARSVCQQQGDCAVEKIATLDMAAAVRVPTAGRLCSREMATLDTAGSV
eukprot:g16401.t1